MCSITALLDRSPDLHDAWQHVLHARGFKFIGAPILSFGVPQAKREECHHRARVALAIVDVMSEHNPLKIQTEGRNLAVNGEIHNHTSIRDFRRLPRLPLAVRAAIVK